MIKRTLAALALTATVAQPAAANDDLIKGIFATIIIHEVLKNSHNTHTVIVEQPTHRYPRQVCNREIERLRNGMTYVHEFDCYGNIVRSYPR